LVLAYAFYCNAEDDSICYQSQKESQLVPIHGTREGVSCSVDCVLIVVLANQHQSNGQTFFLAAAHNQKKDLLANFTTSIGGGNNAMVYSLQDVLVGEGLISRMLSVSVVHTCHIEPACVANHIKATGECLLKRCCWTGKRSSHDRQSWHEQKIEMIEGLVIFSS